MSKSNLIKDKESKVAAWLCDEFGGKGEKDIDYRRDAQDFIRFMKANGWELRPTNHNRERPPF